LHDLAIGQIPDAGRLLAALDEATRAGQAHPIMKLELISHTLCPFVHRAAIMLHEKGVPFERRNVDLKNKPDWFLAISPRGKVPVLLADGVALFESAAICEFLDETHPPPLIPTDPFERARQRAWVEVANDLLAAQFKAFAAAEPAEAEKARAAADALLVRFEEALTAGAISDSAFGLIHVAVAPALHRFVVVADRLGVDFFAHTPKLAALSRSLANRPSVAETVPEDFGKQFIQILAERGSLLLAGKA
jgi:glutathione S-transferase